LTELFLVADGESMPVGVTPDGDSILVEASDDGEIRHLGLCFCFRIEILTLGAPLVILKAALGGGSSAEVL